MALHRFFMRATPLQCGHGLIPCKLRAACDIFILRRDHPARRTARHRLAAREGLPVALGDVILALLGLLPGVRWDAAALQQLPDTQGAGMGRQPRWVRCSGCQLLIEPAVEFVHAGRGAHE